MHILSKSRFIRGLQCEKALYLETYRKELAVVSIETRAKFAQGRSFERTFKDTFPQGIDIDEQLGRQVDKYPELTAHLLEQTGDVVLFEAGFLYQGVLVLADVVHKHVDGSVEVMEVKNSSVVKPVFRNDVYVQHYVISHAISNLCGFSVVYRGADEEHPFAYLDLMEEAEQHAAFIEEQIQRFTSLLNRKQEPVIAMGDQCNQPYECPFKDYCSHPQPIQLSLDFDN
ncbi:MAG: hypothetical protein II532_01150 [Bacteroidales bacterium]|nr:hypothetical protein [Bacteroidales bacterium]